MKKNLLVWATGYASGRAAGRDLIISLEQGSSFVQQLQPERILRPFGQDTPAIAEGEAGIFVGQVAVQRCRATLAKTSFAVPIFQDVASDIRQPVFNPTLDAWNINK